MRRERDGNFGDDIMCGAHRRCAEARLIVGGFIVRNNGQRVCAWNTLEQSISQSGPSVSDRQVPWKRLPHYANKERESKFRLQYQPQHMCLAILFRPP